MKRDIQSLMTQMWRDEAGVLSYEWVLLLTLLVLGIVGGVAAARDAIIDELGDAAQAMQALDGSYTIDFPLVFTIDGVLITGGSDSGFTDAITYTDCTRAAAPLGQTPRNVLDSDS
jgi:Flp pilus assembly pilin Flp